MKTREARAGAKLLRAAFAATAVALLAPASALGATVSADGNTLNVVGAPGEANELVVSWSFGTWVVNDSLPVTAGAGCSVHPSNPARARCAVSGIETVVVDAGDGDDNVTNFTLVGSTLSGGPGGDTLNGGLGRDSLSGGEGDDGLYASWGDDVLEGGAGTDVFDGNLGADTLRSQDDLAETVDCGDDIDSYLSDASDTLTACEQDLAVVTDPLPAGTGSVGPGGETPGTGTGTGTGTGGQDPVETVISQVTLLTPAARTLVVDGAGTVALQVECATAEIAGCQGTITLELLPGARKATASRRGGRPVGRRSFRVKPGRRAKVEVRVSRRGRRIIAKRKKSRIRARIDTQTASGTQTTYRSFDVRASRRGGSKKIVRRRR